MHKNDGLLFLSPGFSGGSLSGVRILGLAADGYACGNYRVNYPLQVAAFHGASVRIRNVSICPVTMEEVLEADIIYCQRFTDPNLCKMFSDVQKAKGTKLIYDLDDALTCVPPSSPAFDDYSTNTKKGREHLAGIEGFLEAADTVVFSTRELQAVYSKYRHKSYVVPNGLDIKLSARDWTTGKTEWHAEAQKQGFTPEADSVLVGVAGGKTHFHDWKLLASSLERITKESAAFIGIQADPAVVEELLSGYWNNVRDRVVVFKPETYENYPATLAKFDINLAPLQNNRFNLGKSPLRLLELGAWGIPYVASDVAPFHRFHKESGGLCGELAQGNDFASPALALIHDRDLMSRKSAAIKEFVRTKCDAVETAKSVPLIIRAALLGVRTLSDIDISDARLGIPDVKFPLKSRSLCPCGTSKLYGQCCAPAFGRL